jgi:hypothetical protein
VVKKYGFEGGFNEAMQSIAAVGGQEQDEKIRGLMVSSLVSSLHLQRAATD